MGVRKRKTKRNDHFSAHLRIEISRFHNSFIAVFDSKKGIKWNGIEACEREKYCHFRRNILPVDFSTLGFSSFQSLSKSCFTLSLHTYTAYTHTIAHIFTFFCVVHFMFIDSLPLVVYFLLSFFLLLSFISLSILLFLCVVCCVCDGSISIRSPLLYVSVMCIPICLQWFASKSSKTSLANV